MSKRRTQLSFLCGESVAIKGLNVKLEVKWIEPADPDEMGDGTSRVESAVRARRKGATGTTGRWPRRVCICQGIRD
jgi:hypothetical protein